MKGMKILKKVKKKFKGKLTDDEPYYDSSDCDSFQSDEEELVFDNELKGRNLRGRKRSNGVIYDSTCDVVIWQCGLIFESVKEFRETVTKYTDHVAEFNRILDYKDVLLQTNPGSTCVVKLTDSESENGMKQVHSFYICFDAMKKVSNKDAEDGGIERKKKFWACARSTFEAQSKYNINALFMLGAGIVEALIKYNKEKLCKKKIQTFSKCDSIDNNMAESFNV
ncbi:hypothetical protein H5410_029097 [Solanum commersonii]|uniref:Uncharacterized protein n=1 Tax=Solanum commersonii TaxID=4109 RepID=A0A9J5Z5V1_SOLCO|nr:hypothetical protein H5410_029097 [Solanum commersonii]